MRVPCWLFVRSRRKDFGVARGPVELFAQMLDVDDVPDEIEDVTARVTQEVE